MTLVRVGKNPIGLSEGNFSGTRSGVFGLKASDWIGRLKKFEITSDWLGTEVKVCSIESKSR